MSEQVEKTLPENIHLCPPATDFSFVCDACKVHMLETKALRRDFFGGKTQKYYAQLYFWMNGKVWWCWVDPEVIGGTDAVWTTVDKIDYQFDILIAHAQIAQNETPATLGKKMWENTRNHICVMHAPVKTKHKALF